MAPKILNKRGTWGECGLRIERLRSWGAEFQLSESNISGEKNWGVGNINQSVHLVGNHMADQHANSANLLIFSNGVQLIPLAAFISPSHTEGREVEKKKGEQRRVCYDSLLFFLNSFLFSLSLEAEESNSGDEWGGHKGLG